jgi:hypothetical protein
MVGRRNTLSNVDHLIFPFKKEQQMNKKYLVEYTATVADKRESFTIKGKQVFQLAVNDYELEDWVKSEAEDCVYGMIKNSKSDQLRDIVPTISIDKVTTL